MALLCLVGFPSLEDGLYTMDYSDWLDLDAFIELNVSTPHLVLPFAFAPCIYYLGQTNREHSTETKRTRAVPTI
jgi:hypothetical protein